MSRLGEKLLGISHALTQAGIPHAFGGAIALAYCTHDPRATSDLDINIFVPPTDSRRVVTALPPAVRHRQRDTAALRREGQVRLWWDRTPIDIFLNTHSFHEDAAKSCRNVPFEGEQIPIISCESLAVFKAMFNRPKDWVDIDEMVHAGAIHPAVIAATVHSILGSDPRVERLLAISIDGSRPQPSFPSVPPPGTSR